jgi:hypothetical protein
MTMRHEIDEHGKSIFINHIHIPRFEKLIAKLDYMIMESELLVRLRCLPAYMFEKKQS